MPALPACFPLINANYFNNIETQIGVVVSAAELQALTNRVMAELSLLESTLTSQLSFLAPINALLTAPAANLGAIVAWITNMIVVLEEMYKPYVNIVAELAALPAIIAALVAAIEAAALRLNVTITIPSVGVICTL